MSLQVKNVSFSYGAQPVLNRITFDLEYGTFLSVLGANGAGKSTLFRCVLGLLQPQAGEILVDGKNIRDCSARELSRKLAYIPQSNHPVFNYSVMEMVLMGTTAQIGSFSSPGAAQRTLAADALERLGIAHLQNRGFRKISGGERQLVLIARALAQKAKILIMDEPTASLDVGNRIRVMQTVRSLADEGYAVMQSTHDPEQAYYYSDAILALSHGEVLAKGTPKEIISRENIAKLYGNQVDVRSVLDDRLRVCLPKNMKEGI